MLCSVRQQQIKIRKFKLKQWWLEDYIAEHTEQQKKHVDVQIVLEKKKTTCSILHAIKLGPLEIFSCNSFIIKQTFLQILLKKIDDFRPTISSLLILIIFINMIFLKNSVQTHCLYESNDIVSICCSSKYLYIKLVSIYYILHACF